LTAAADLFLFYVIFVTEFGAMKTHRATPLQQGHYVQINFAPMCTNSLKQKG
jgi:hypothetical protein